MEQGKTYTTQIQERDLDFMRRPTFSSLCDSVLMIAGYDANERNWGIEKINKDGLTWVLSRMSFEWSKIPNATDTIFVETWVSSVNRLMSTREFIIRDQKGTQIGAATTLWAMIDLESRHPVDLRTQIDYTRHIIDKPSPIVALHKFPTIEYETTHTHKVAYSDLDFNNHTNTMKYIEWMCDLIPLEWHKRSFIKRFDIHFIHEALYGETLTINCQSKEPTSHFEIKNQRNITICKACITL